MSIESYGVLKSHAISRNQPAGLFNSAKRTSNSGYLQSQIGEWGLQIPPTQFWEAHVCFTELRKSIRVNITIAIIRITIIFASFNSDINQINLFLSVILTIFKILIYQNFK